MTKRENLTAMLNDEYICSNADWKAYLENELVLVNRKNSYKSTKPTKNQVRNEELKDKILEVLDKPMTATEVFNAIPELGSVNKASALLTQLKEDNSIVRTVGEKRKAYFSKVE